MIYADYAATTPLDSRVFEVMKPYFQEQYFNPSALYPQAQKIRKEIEQARSQVAELLDAESEEIIFTSGGTEADNMAIKGIAFALREKGKHLITSQIEHHAVLASFQFLERQGFEVTYLPVDDHFRVSVEAFESAIRPDTILASIMMANNETGAIQPIQELAAIARSEGVYFHTDAVQAITTCKISVRELGVDALSISGHKIYGPKGSGALYLKTDTPIVSWITGGDQEGGYRGGTESVANLIGLGEAARILQSERADRENHGKVLRKRLMDELKRQNLDFQVHQHPTYQLSHIANIGFREVESESLLMHLMLRGIVASLGAACNSSSVEPSYVLEAGKVDRAYIKGSVRFSFGQDTSVEDVDRLASEVKQILDLIRKVNF
ncbi:cysteine desulfurase NifS [Gottschalkiaceae bacterium SANA]|nr:cysteine desulfurase NifS [Gottschalkiaceae bacterium SANA]